MQAAARITLSMFLLVTVVSASHSGTKLRRDGVLNLYPFPRVGRSSHQTWQIPINDLLDQEIDKRQLYAFPRVGRSYPMQMSPRLEDLIFGRNRFVKRESEGASDSTGMWFGPRLGRGFRSEDDEMPNQEERSEPEQTDPEQTGREKRQIKET
ncbi:CAPA peptides-like [Colias croceus]|uniref:CAPA peptides-like n=1 Tax=Colias crocea TaxID=72248 RepID=UPI001E27C5BE|nr:CAPA peptides-like [Colias croceus]